ncbi:hypothetical protein GCM10017687_44260 [Streptomyces echinatus]
MAAANPRASAADGWELSPPLANRFVHLYWVHDREVVVRGLGGVWAPGGAAPARAAAAAGGGGPTTGVRSPASCRPGPR